MHTSTLFAPSARSQRRPARGFTLIELMIAVAVIGILATIAYPTYAGTLQKIRRCDALVTMLSVQMAQERYRGNSMTYGSLAHIGMPSLSQSRHYALEVTALSATGYEVLASAVGAQSADTACRHMKMVVDGMNVTYLSGTGTDVDNSAALNKKCWNL